MEVSHVVNREKGTLPGSNVYFPLYPGFITDNYFYITATGHFLCTDEYLVERSEYPDPIIIYIIRGILAVESDGICSKAGEGDIVILDCQSAHKYYADPEVEFVFLHFAGATSVSMAKNLIRQNNGHIFSGPLNTRIMVTMSDTIGKLRDDRPVPGAEISRRLYNILCFLTPSGETASEMSETISASVNYIHEHISQELSVSTLASAAYLSPYYFSRLFRKETGFSPMEYVATVRLNIAKKLLRTTEIPVHDIAAQLGYNSCGGFINAFTRKLGVSPGKFRHYPM